MILVVDDHVDTCHAVMRLLRSSGYVAQCSHDGAEALALAARVNPRVVILDVMMPGMSGVDVLRAMRADAALAAVPVLMYSASDNPAHAEEAARLGAKGFILKGTDWAAFIARVGSLAGPPA